MRSTRVDGGTTERLGCRRGRPRANAV